MKTSKRLLSFILAVVMALTACSAGFTALAAEVNPKDNSPFSAQNASAKDSVDALNALIDQYLPSILEMLGEDTLASAGLDLEKIKTADFNDKNIQSDSFYEMMSELSILVYSALGGASMSAVLADEGLSYGDAYDETMYLYLNEVSSPIDFWSLYQLYKDNAKDGGNEMEQLCYDYLNGTDSITGLKDLLQAQPTLFASAQSTVEATSSYVNEWAIALNAGYVDDGAGVLVLYDGITVESIQKAIDEYEAANGKIVLSGTDSNGQTVDVESYYSYINYVYKYAGISVNVDSLAKAIYYGAFENLYMPLMFAYVEELRENGITELFGVSADSINTDNFLSIIESNLYSYSDHKAMMKDMGITDEAQVKATYKIYAILLVSEVFLNYSDYLPQDYIIEERILSFAVNATISTQLEAYKYNPENYPVDSSFMINAANSIINGYVDMIDNLNDLVSGIDLDSIVNSLMSSFIITEGPNGEVITIEFIASNLRDVYINLAEDPVLTIANLMPILTILLDEVVVPILFNQDGDASHDALDALLGEIDAINTLRDQYGITRLDFDLNTIIPRLLHYIAGDNSLVTEYYSDSEVPVITTVKALDELIMPLKNYNFGISDAVLNDLLKNVIDTLKTTADEYVSEHGNDIRMGRDIADGVKAPIARGFNNIFTALPVFIDMFVKNFAAEFGINSDWSFDCRIAYGTDTDAKGNEYVTAENVSLSEIKPYVFDENPDASKITSWLVDLIISDWLNAVIDLVNDILTTDNTVTTNIPIITSLLNSLGGFGDTSIITDVLNGFFGLTRTSDYSFELVEREIPLSTDKNARYVGFSSDSTYYLIANIGTVVEIVLNIVNSNSSEDATQSAADDPVTTADEALNTASVYAAAANTSDSSSNVAIDFEKILEDFNAIITQENQQATDELLAKADSVLSSLLANTYINGFSADQLDNILASVLTFLTNHFGQENANEIVNLLMDYLKAINAQATTADGSKNANSNGDLDPKKIYSSENLSNLVTRTYVLLEKIINDSLAIAGDEYNCINNAIMGVFSPSAVAIRSDVLNTDLQKYTSWTEISNSKYAKNLGYDFKAGNKEAFYTDLVDSLGAITAIAGALLCSTDYYNNILSPVFGAICKQLNVNYLSSVTADTSGSDVVYGIIETVSNIASELLSKPMTSIMDILKGVIDLMSDSNLKKIINGAIDPLVAELNGLEKIVQVISPSFQLKIDIGGTEGDTDNDIVSKIENIKNDIPEQDVLVWLINNISSLLGAGNIMDSIGIDGSTISMIISSVPAISNAQIVLLLYTAAIDIILDPGILKTLFGDSYNNLKSLAEQLSKLDASSVLNMIKDIISVTQNPSEIYWTFEDYIAKETNSFSFPKGITQTDADDAVDSLDELVANVFLLLQSFDVVDQSSLTELVSGLLYKNSLITDIAKAVYGGIENSANGVFSFTPSQFAAYLTDKSYGATYSSTANQLKKYSSWNDIKNINWGFTDGSSKAEQGFINALVALCRPVNDVLAAFLAEGDANIAELVSLVLKDLQFSTDLSTDAMQIKLVLKNNQLIFTFLNKEVSDAVENVIKVDISPILSELSNLKISGVNGYQSAIIPLLEALMCDNVKTYSQYLKDYNKAKDNLLLDIINPIFGFVDDVLAAPFDTLTKVLPNVAYFLENGGLGQFLDNLLAPLTKIIDVLNKYGLNVDSIIKSATGKSLGDLLGDLLGVSGLKLNLNDLSSINIHKLLIPIVNELLKNNGINITLPDIDWSALASLGSQNAVSSAAGGNTIRITANQGQVLVTLLRYVETALINNAGSINKLLSGIDAIKNNKTISAILDSIFAQISTANRDEIVLAVFYLLLQQPINSFFDYSGFKFKEYDFSYPETVDIDFLTSIGPMLDGLINGLIDNGAGLSSLVVSSLYNDDIISSIAVGLYGAVEGVKINDSMNLTQLLAETGIDFSTKNVAALLTDKDYGQKYSSAAKVIGRVNSWSKVNADSLSWGVKDRDTFLHALCAVLRPLYGVLDVLLNDASLGLFNVIYLPGSDGYTSSIVPLMEAFGLYNIKTQYQYREDMTKEYDAILLDILNPLMDKVEDLLNAPIQILSDMLPNLALFFANDGLLQLIENLLAPINALLDALEPIADVNDILVKAGLNISKELSNIGLVGSGYKFDIYDLTASLKPLIGADNIVSLLNEVLGMIDINGSKLGIELMPIDWFQLASHGELIKTDASQASTFDGRVYVKADQSEVLVAVFRYLIETVNYKDNYNIISDLIGGLIGGADSSTSDMVNEILEMLIGDTDKVISDLCGLLQALA